MSNESKTQGAAKDDDHAEARRKFLKRAGQVAVTTPAVTMLLAGGAKIGKAEPITSLFIDDPEDDPIQG